MKKNTIADKMAEKAFFSESIQQSWRIHLRTFGPILEPAFVDDYQAKTHLCAALNEISRSEVAACPEELKQEWRFRVEH